MVKIRETVLFTIHLILTIFYTSDINNSKHLFSTHVYLKNIFFILSCKDLKTHLFLGGFCLYIYINT